MYCAMISAHILIFKAVMAPDLSSQQADTETKLELEAQRKPNQELEAEESKAGDDLDPAKSIKSIPIIVETLHTIFPPQAVQAQDLSLSQHN
ncbi:hypothetical protein Bca4012_026477 [Brassica carinata]